MIAVLEEDWGVSEYGTDDYPEKLEPEEHPKTEPPSLWDRFIDFIRG